MCGLVGYINKEVTGSKLSSYSFDKVFNQMLICDSLRGLHSTGLLTVSSKGNSLFYKKAINAIDFLELPVTKRLLSVNNTFVVGHNRHATSGAVSDTNAHPFNHGDITLFHNGTLTIHFNLNKETYAVDSEAITANFNSTDSIKKSLESLKGAYSLIWFDSSDETLNFARNKERPMHFAQVKNSGSIFFASEPGMLKWILDRNDIAYESINSTKDGVHISIPLDSKGMTTISQFTPYDTQTYDYSAYYTKGSGNKVSNLPTKTATPSLLKDVKSNSFLLELKSISLMALDFIPYQHGNNYGYIECEYSVPNELPIKINVTGVRRQEADALIGKLIDIRINSIPGYKQAYASLIGLAKKKELSLITTPDEDDPEDDELWEKQIEAYYNSLSGKNDEDFKEIKKCKNCSDSLTHDNFEGSGDYCRPCLTSINDCL